MASRPVVIIIAHFDAHGVSTAAARARVVGTARAYARFPHTGPEKLPEFIDTFWAELTSASVEVIDIPVNLRDPATFIEALERLARNTQVSYYDHHATDVQFTSRVSSPIRWFLFADAMQMLQALVPKDAPEFRLGLVGVVADRDAAVLSMVSRETVERDLMPLACALDVLVRRDTQGTLDQLIAARDPVAWLREQAVEYPPYDLAEQISIKRRSHVAVLVDFTALEPKAYAPWVWKTMEQVALKERRPYVVATAMVFDRQTGRYVPAVQVIRYWLARDRPEPRPLVESVLGGRTVIGHPDAFSVRCLDESDMEALAEQIFRQLTAPVSRVTRLISEPTVAEAVQADFAAILDKLTQVLETQQRMYEEYLELKRRQVELLERMERGHPAD